jgi:hypothetical protein
MASAPRPPTSPTESWGQTPTPNPVPAMGGDLGEPPAIERGALVILRQFDVSDEVDLEKVQALVAAARHPLARPRGTPMVLPIPPATVPLGLRRVLLAGESFDAELTARVFAFGSISIRLRVPLPEGVPWSFAAALVRDAQVDDTLTRVAREETEKLVDRLRPALQGVHHSELFEDYVVLFVERFQPARQATTLPLGAVARLLLGEKEDARLAEAEVIEATRHRSSYYGDDLCVTAWSTALVVEPNGEPDVLDVLELANAQLLELRYYDELLDRALARLYDEVGERRGRGPWLFRNYGPVLHRAMALMLEIAEFVERVENALKIIGDTYLARLYASAVDSLRIPAWERSVTRKQALVQQVYDVLKHEVDASRTLLLEVLVVALIISELIVALGGGH